VCLENFQQTKFIFKIQQIEQGRNSGLHSFGIPKSAVSPLRQSEGSAVSLGNCKISVFIDGMCDEELDENTLFSDNQISSSLTIIRNLTM